jgi:hypothetical protein
MSNEIEMKKQVLDMLKAFMLGEDGKKFGPKEEKPSLVEEDESEEVSEPTDEVADEDDEEKVGKKLSLKEFLASK